MKNFKKSGAVALPANTVKVYTFAITKLWHDIITELSKLEYFKNLCHLTVSFRLGEVLDPYTKLHMVIHGDKGDTEKIYLTPKGGRLEPGKLYTVTVRTTDVGNVSATGHPLTQG